MKRVFLIILLATITIIVTGCAKVAIKDPVHLPGLGENFASVNSTENVRNPIFHNGDIVKHKMFANKEGLMMASNYKYLDDLKTWYCVVDFYPSSAAIHFDFSNFDNYERRFVYEFELDLVQKYSRRQNLNARWKSMDLLTE